MKGKTEPRQIRQRKASKPMLGREFQACSTLAVENATKDVQKARSNQNQQLSNEKKNY